MSTSLVPSQKKWTISEAKARLSELLRLVMDDGPQYIGTKKTFVIVSEEEWLSLQHPQKPLGLWLVDNIPTVGELELPDRHERERTTPFQ